MSSESAIDKWKDRPEWMKGIDIEEYEKLAAIGYSPKMIAMYYRIPEADFMWHFCLIGSPLKYHYERGVLVQQAKEGITMTDAAATGENITLMQRLDRMRQQVEFKNNVSKVFFDDIS